MSSRRSLGPLGSLCVVMLGLFFSGAACRPPPVSEPIVTGFSDFPEAPLAGGSLSAELAADLARHFAAGPRQTGGPCLTEPSFGALYPHNFSPPLFEWTAINGQNVFELRLKVSNQKHEFVVYTDEVRYTMPSDIWSALSANSPDFDVTISVAGGRLSAGQLAGGAFAGSSGTVHIAPVDAEGVIVYWTTSSGSALKSFRIGDSQVQTILTPSLITKAGTPTGCIGCHASSPDGLLVFFGRVNPPYSVDARLSNGYGAAAPSWVSQNALTNLARTSQDLPILSKAHYSDSDAVVITIMNNGAGGRWELNWTDLRATAGGTGIIARTGDPNGAAVATWSHDGSTLVYSSSTAIVDSHPDKGDSDLWRVPYNNRNGGAASELPGANDPAANQFYPAYSPGDAWIAFNRNPRGSQMYDSANAEVWVIASRGGQPVRLASNDPPACSSTRSPGVTNSWPRWSPSAWSVGGKHYYWLVFSSRRRAFGSSALFPPQLFLSAVVTRDGPGGEVIESTSSALYLPAQPASESNHTPAWDNFVVPAG